MKTIQFIENLITLRPCLPKKVTTPRLIPKHYQGLHNLSSVEKVASHEKMMRVGYMTPFPSKYLMCRATNGILTSYVLTQMGALSMLNLTMQAGDVTLIMQHLNHLPKPKVGTNEKGTQTIGLPFFALPTNFQG